MKAVIVGLGQFGRAAAIAFARMGAETVAIDKNPDAVKAVQDEVDLAVTTDASDIDNLAAHGTEHADLLIAGIGDDFEAQILTIVHAKKLGVPRVLARANSPSHEQALLAVGADEVLDPERDSAEALVLRIMSKLDSGQLKLAEGIHSVTVTASADLIGRPLRTQNLDFIESKSVHLVALLRAIAPDKREALTGPDEHIELDDQLLLVGEPEALNQLLEDLR